MLRAQQNIDSLFGDSFTNADTDNNDNLDILDLVIIIDIVLSGNNQCEEFIPIDLSLDWEAQEDLSYIDSEALQEIVDLEISGLDLIRGIIVIHNGKIVSEGYYNGSSEDEIYNIFSVTKSYISTLIGQAIYQDLIDNQYSTLDSFFPEYFCSSSSSSLSSTFHYNFPGIGFIRT